MTQFFFLFELVPFKKKYIYFLSNRIFSRFCLWRF
jgi:hypothetical protein